MRIVTNDSYDFYPQYKPLIDPIDVENVHHLNIMKCNVPDPLGMSEGSVLDPYLPHEEGIECYSKADPWKYCWEFKIVSGVSSQGDIFPEHIGDPFGDPDKPTYYRLEAHYENPMGKKCTYIARLLPLLLLQSNECFFLKLFFAWFLCL